MTRPVLVLLLAVFLTACGGSAGRGAAPPPHATETAEPPEPAEADEEIVRQDTPYGEAAIQLVVEPREIRPGEMVTIRLMNRGEVPLLTGRVFNVERWDGEGWVEVPWPENSVFPLIATTLPPEGSTDPQTWPEDGAPVQPGLYRVLKSASYEGVWPNLHLQPQTRFRVRRNG